MEFEMKCPISADLALIRDLIRIHGTHSGLHGSRLDSWVLAVNEAVTNVLDHAGATGQVVARSVGDTITVEVVDTAGRLTPGHLRAARVDPTASHGFGLWVIQQVCDAVHVEQSGRGSRLSLRMRRRPAARPAHAGRARFTMSAA
ncbi:ATP-binding protein [Nonomuraea sp. NPDC002799]